MKGVSEKNSGMTQDGRNDLLLAVRGLRTRFFTYEGQFDAVNGVDLNIRKNESVGLVGETVCHSPQHHETDSVSAWKDHLGLYYLQGRGYHDQK
jgi:hypothetical protein